MSTLLKDKNGNTSSKRVAGYSIGGLGVAMGIALFTVALFKVIADREGFYGQHRTC